MSAVGTTTNVVQAFVQMLFFVDQPRAVFAYFSDQSSKHNATDVSLAEVPPCILVTRATQLLPLHFFNLVFHG